MQPRINDYTNRDFSSLLTSLLDLAALKFPEWTDRSENDMGRMLLEQFAYLGDVLLYYQDRIANEAFLATAIERRSVIDLLALIGYTLATPSPASARLTIRAPNDAATPVRVDVGARFATQALPDKPAIEFIYLPITGLPLEIPRTGAGGEVTAGITVVNASQVVNEVLGTSTGEANQSFKLAQRPVLLPRDPNSQENLRVEVNAGGGFEVWEKRGTLLYSHSNDPHFIVQINEDDEAEITLGDGTYGRIPPAGGTIRASYLIGGGEVGNVGPNTITVVKSGVNVSVTVTNAAASGGADRETIEHARRLAPGVFRSLDRAVTAADYAALAENVPGVARAVAVSSSSPDPFLRPSWNYVDLYVVAAGGLELDEVLYAELFRYFEKRRMVTTIVTPRQPVFVSINFVVSVGAESSFYKDDVKRRAEEALSELFRIDRLDFGQTFYLSKVFETVESLEGVAFAEVTAFSGMRSDPPSEVVDPSAAARGRIPLRPMEFPRQGTITVTVTGGLS